MKHIPTFESFLNGNTANKEESVTEASKKGLDVTQWSKWPDSKNGDVFVSKRQGAIAVRVDGALRPMHYYTDPVVWMSHAFDTDKQFTEMIKPAAKDIADAYYGMHRGGSNTKEKADAFGKAAEDAIKKILKGEKLPMPVVVDDE
jgi:hypothetical protein